MKLFKLLIFFAILFLFVIPVAFATSGACSYHGGVDCKAGKDGDGSVICNDGWEDSSVQYNDMVGCSNDYTINIDSSYDRTLRFQMAKNACLDIYSGFSTMFFDEVDANMEKGQESTTAWANASRTTSSYCKMLKEQNEQESLERCGNSGEWDGNECQCPYQHFWSNKKGQCLGRELACEEVGIENSYLGIDDNCYCKTGYGWDKNGETCISETEICKKTYGKHSIKINDGHNKFSCSCESGYAWGKEHQCVTVSDWCKEGFGDKAISVLQEGIEVCSCKNGYLLNSTQTTCVPNLFSTTWFKNLFKYILIKK